MVKRRRYLGLENVQRIAKLENICKVVDYKFFTITGRVKDDSKFGNKVIVPNLFKTYTTNVMKLLRLYPGLKFLNIGSGSGYLNTLVGFMLSKTGINHGIDINNMSISYSKHTQEEFKLNASAIDYYEYCEPHFINGNVLELRSSMGYYDRVYCHCIVQSEQFIFMQKMIKIGGVLIIPFNGMLIQVIRIAEYKWHRHVIFNSLSTHHGELVVLENNNTNKVDLPSAVPPTLQQFCRYDIRSRLRNELKEPSLYIRCTKIAKPPSDKPNKEQIKYHLHKPFYSLTRYNRYVNLKKHFTNKKQTSASNDMGRKNLLFNSKRVYGNLVEVVNPKTVKDKFILYNYEKYTALVKKYNNFDRKADKLSQCLKNKIDLLPLTKELRMYLNYEQDTKPTI